MRDPSVNVRRKRVELKADELVTEARLAQLSTKELLNLVKSFANAQEAASEEGGKNND